MAQLKAEFDLEAIFKGVQKELKKKFGKITHSNRQLTEQLESNNAQLNKTID